MPVSILQVDEFPHFVVQWTNIFLDFWNNLLEDVEEVKNRSRKKGVYCQLQQQKKQQQPPHSKMHIFFSAGFNALLNSLDRCLEKGPSRSILFSFFFGIETIFRHIIISFWLLDFSSLVKLNTFGQIIWSE